MHQADCRRCFQQRKSLCNKLIQTEVFWFRRDQYVMKVPSVLSVPQHQSGDSWSALLRNIWISNRTYGGAVFTLQTLLTCCQIACSGRGCVLLQCWAENEAFPILRTLDNVWVGKPILKNYRHYVEHVTNNSTFQPSLPHWLLTFNTWNQCANSNPLLSFFSIPRTAALSHRKPPSASHPVGEALIPNSIQGFVYPCDGFKLRGLLSVGCAVLQ